MAKIDLSRIMLAAAVTVTAPGMMAGAHADQDDTVSVVAGYALRHEDNLFRLPRGADTRAATGELRSFVIGFSTTLIRWTPVPSIASMNMSSSIGASMRRSLESSMR